MKKIYESPQTIVVRLAVQNVIAVSYRSELGSDVSTDGDKALSSGYRNSLWGDNE